MTAVAVWAFLCGVVVLAATPAVIVAAGLFTVGMVCARHRRLVLVDTRRDSG